MIELKDLENRVYRNKSCTEFSYGIKNEKGEEILKARFIKGGLMNQWNLRIVIDRTRDADSQVYNFGYVMPKSNLPLELIAATGLRYFQMYLKEEIQKKSELDFALGEVIKGM